MIELEDDELVLVVEIELQFEGQSVQVPVGGGEVIDEVLFEHVLA